MKRYKLPRLTKAEIDEAKSLYPTIMPLKGNVPVPTMPPGGLPAMFPEMFGRAGAPRKPPVPLDNAHELRTLMKGSRLTRAATASLLYVSPHTIDAWLKPKGSKSANPAPRWAVELLAFKTRQPVPVDSSSVTRARSEPGGPLSNKLTLPPASWPIRFTTE